MMTSQASDSYFQRLRQALELFFRKVEADRLSDRSSSMAFQLLFSLVPIIALAYAVFAWLGGFEKLRESVSQWLLQYLAPSMSEQVGDYLASIERRVSPEAVGVFGVLGFLFTVFNLVGKAEEALNAIWGITHTRSWGQRIALFAAAVIVMPLALGGSLFLSSYLASMITTGVTSVFPSNEFTRRTLVLVLTVVPILITGLFLALSYGALPFARVDRRAALQAGFVTGLILEAMKYGYTFYASYALSHSIYGSLAALPVFFLWISLSCQVYLLGAELCYFLDQKRSGVWHVQTPEAELSVSMLIAILKVFDRYRESLSTRQLIHEIGWDQSVVNRHVQYLKQEKFIRPEKHPLMGEEFFAASFGRLDAAVRELLERINSVKYEQWVLESGV